MKLLFDENLSPELPRLLAENFPNSVHVRDLGLVGADDIAIWHAAATHGLVLATKDDDFVELSVLKGAPPKVVVLRLGNCRTSEVATLFLSERARLQRFHADADASILELP